MDKVYIHWNITNWITVVLMATVGFAVLGFLSQAYKNKVSQNG